MNAVTTKDVSALRHPMKADEYDDLVGTPAYGVYGIEGVADYGLGVVRTSRRAEGIGFLDTPVLGMPLWMVALGGIAAVWILPKVLGKR